MYRRKIVSIFPPLLIISSFSSSIINFIPSEIQNSTKKAHNSPELENIFQTINPRFRKLISMNFYSLHRTSYRWILLIIIALQLVGLECNPRLDSDIDFSHIPDAAFPPVTSDFLASIGPLVEPNRFPIGNLPQSFANELYHFCTLARQ
jgi:hypothetical protein